MSVADMNAVVAYEATISLYPVGPDRQPIRSFPLWMGGTAASVKMSKRFPSRSVRPTGDSTDRTIQLGTDHNIELQRCWLVRTSTPADFDPKLGEHCLEIVWQDQFSGVWTRRLYYGVTWIEAGWASSGLFQFALSQSMRARSLVITSGHGAVDSAPDWPTSGEFPFAFTQAGALWASDSTAKYLQGRISIPFTTRLSRVVVEGVAGRSATTIELVLNGNAQSTTIVLPGNSSNIYVNAAASPSSVIISPNTEMRWRASSGPSVQGDCATRVGLAAYLVPVDV